MGLSMTQASSFSLRRSICVSVFLIVIAVFGGFFRRGLLVFPEENEREDRARDDEEEEGVLEFHLTSLLKSCNGWLLTLIKPGGATRR
jgi:hypothetical protein